LNGAWRLLFVLFSETKAQAVEFPIENCVVSAEEGKKATEGGEVKKEEEGEAKADAEMKETPEKEQVKEETKDEVKEEVKDGAVKSEVKEEKEDVKKEEEEEEEKEEPCPVAELTAEEKAMSFKKKATSDLTNWVLSQQFAKFTLPTGEEGFDEVRFSWQKKDKSEEYFKAWILKQKILCRMEELQPGEWFRTKWTEWQKVMGEWHQKQLDFKDPIKEMARKQAEEDAKAAKAEEERKAKEAKEAAAAGSAEGGAAEEEKKEEAKGEEGGEKSGEKTGEKSEEAAAEKPADEETKEVDIFTLEDVCDAGGGEPLFQKFNFEDWALLSLRFELYLLCHAFKNDASDPERLGIHETHLAFYYNKYYRKSFNVRYYGVDTNLDLVSMVKDAVTVGEGDKVLATTLSDEVNFDMFIRLTEDARRERQRRLDAGDESAKLKINKPPEAPQPYQGGAPHGSGGYGGYKGGGKVGGGYAPQRGATVPPPAYHGGSYGGAKGGPYNQGGYKGRRSTFGRW